MSAAPNASAPVVLRSMLYVPADKQRFIVKAHTRGADAIILDLEDSIAAQDKDRARDGLGDAVATLSGNGVGQLYVRVNSGLRLVARDLEAAIVPGVTGVILPKARSVDHVRLVSELIGELEMERGLTPGSVGLGPRIETASAFFEMDRIAAADPRVTSFGLGGEDFSHAIGVEPAVDTLIYPKQRAIIAAHAAGVTPLGLVSSGADYSDPDGFLDIVRQSRRFGFEGASCIHPSLVPLLNAGFAPSAEEVEHARRVMEVFEASEGSATKLDGKMIDYPIVFRAQRVLAKHAVIAQDGRAAS